MKKNKLLEDYISIWHFFGDQMREMSWENKGSTNGRRMKKKTHKSIPAALLSSSPIITGISLFLMAPRSMLSVSSSLLTPSSFIALLLAWISMSSSSSNTPSIAISLPAWLSWSKTEKETNSKVKVHFRVVKGQRVIISCFNRQNMCQISASHATVCTNHWMSFLLQCQNRFKTMRKIHTYCCWQDIVQHTKLTLWGKGKKNISQCHCQTLLSLDLQNGCLQQPSPHPTFPTHTFLHVLFDFGLQYRPQKYELVFAIISFWQMAKYWQLLTKFANLAHHQSYLPLCRKKLSDACLKGWKPRP